LSDVRKVISTGEMSVEGRFVDASNATLFAKCVVGEMEVPVIYKPIAGERPLWDFPDGNLASREVAAYLLSEELGLHLIPFTILRDGPFGPGMVQEWIEIDEAVDVVDLAQGQHPSIRAMALFDAIINNTDRKYGHILPKNPDVIFGCDHGVTFHEDPKLRTVLWQFAGEGFSEKEKQILQGASQIAASLLSEYLTRREVEALNGRLQELLKHGAFPKPSEDWPSIPWPPF
jgi:uncharacterized repeat protein (TIGR03843 family)